MSYTADFTLNLGPANTGLTILAAIRNTDGSLGAKDIAIDGEIGAGNGTYVWHFTGLPDAQRGSVVFYTGTIGAGTDFSAVTVKGAAALDGELERSSSGVIVADGAITSAKFTVASVTGLASATGLLERIVAVWRWCFKRKTGPFTSGQVVAGNINYYADDNSTVIGHQAAADDGTAAQSISAVQDGG